MKKRFICFFLVLLMCFSLAPTVLGSEAENEYQNGASAPGGALDKPPKTTVTYTYTETESKQKESTGTKKDPPPPATHKYNVTAEVKTELLGQNALEGLRFTLYFFEDAKSYSDLYDDPVDGRLYSNAVNLGNIDLVWYVDDGYFDDTVYWSSVDIYKRMGDKLANNSTYKMGSDGNAGLQSGNYLKDQAVGTGSASSIIAGKGGRTISFDSSTLTNLQNIYDDSLSGNAKTKGLNRFFIGRESGLGLKQATEYIKDLNDGKQNVIDYKNTCEIAKLCLGNKGTLDSDPNRGSFIYGFYTDADGVKHNGVLKLYYEPLTAFNIETNDFSSSDEYIFTLHDLIAYSNANPKKQVTTEKQTITYELVTHTVSSSGYINEHSEILEKIKSRIRSLEWDLYTGIPNNMNHCPTDEELEYWEQDYEETKIELENYKNRYDRLKENQTRVWTTDGKDDYKLDEVDIQYDFNGDGKPDYRQVGDPVITYQKKDFSKAFETIYYYMANYTYLIAPEPTLRMTGAGQGPWYYNGKVGATNLKYNRESQTSSVEQFYNSNKNEPEYYTYSTMKSSDREKQSATYGKMFNSMGIGVVTSLNGASDEELKAGPTPQYVKTYVRIKSVDKDGNVTFEKAKNSETGALSFATDSKGEWTNYPLIDTVLKGESEEWVLNDILTSPYLLNDGLNLEIATSAWTDNVNLLHNSNSPIINDGSHTGKSLTKTSDVINGSYIDIVFKSKTFTDFINKNDGTPLLALYNAGIRKVVSKFYEGKTNKLITPDTNIDSQHLDISKGKEAQTGYTLDAVDLSAFYTGGSENNKVSVNNANGEILTAGIKAEVEGKEGVYAVTVDETKHIDTLTQFMEENKDKTPVNTVILRYVEYIKPKQINIIEYQNNDGSVAGYASGGIVDLKKNGNTVTIQDPVGDFKGAIPVEFVTNYEIPLYVLDEANPDLPDMSDGGLSDLNEDGLNRTIVNYPQGVLEHNLYVKWVVTQPYVAVPVDVPEWRLSRFWDAFSEKVGQTDVGISFTYSIGNCNTHKHTLTPTGNFLYNVITEKSDGNERLLVDTWLRGEFIHSDYVPNITNDPTPDNIPVSANMLGVKSTATSGLKTASWVKNNAINSKYKIGSASTGTPSTTTTWGLDSNGNYVKAVDIDVTVKHTGTPFVNTYCTVTRKDFGGYEDDTSKPKKPDGTYPQKWVSDWQDVHDYPLTENESNILTVTPSVLETSISFARYVAKAKSPFVLGSSFADNVKVNQSEGKTTIKYQINDTLNVYPEIGMLMADDDGKTESIKFVVGEQNRKIKPVVWQTLKYNLFVKPVSYGTSVVTDTRFATWLAKNGNSTTKGLLGIYKGAGVNNTFEITDTSTSKESGFLTAKTFILDVDDSVENAWSDSGFKPEKYHANLKAAISGSNKSAKTEVTAIEKLIIKTQTTGGQKTYTGANVIQDLDNYIEDTTSNKVLTHKLIVRGGAVIGVWMDGASSPTAIEDLKTKNKDLYEALIGMNLYNESHNRSKTVLSVFEHKPLNADILDEDDYASALAASRKAIDKIDTPSTSEIKTGDRWYSEDSTVLVVREYRTNYKVPGISVADKISMTVNGLETPRNKNDYFNTVGLGYTCLSYQLEFNAGVLTSNYNNKTITSMFVADASKAGGKFIQNKPSYLVPNVSVTDTTRGG